MVSLHYKGLTIDVDGDGDGYPCVFVYTGGAYADEKGRPAIDVSIDGRKVHAMFSDADGSELLAALKGLVEQLEGIGIPDWHGAEGLSLSQAKAAITRAEGRGA